MESTKKHKEEVLKNTKKSSLYHWKDLGNRCLKWAHMIHLDTFNTIYGQKKGRESN